MRINKLTVQNFRGFEQREFVFPQQFTVLIGNNATGKTAILEALVVGIGSLFLKFDEIPTHNIHNDEVRVVMHRRKKRVNLEPHYPVSVSCEGKLQDQQIVWKRSLRSKKGRTTWGDAAEMTAISQKLQQQVREGRDVRLPVIAYYSAGRLWLQKRQKSVEPVKPGSRMEGYVDCLEAESSSKWLLRWFKTMKLIELEEGEVPAEVRIVKKALKTCVENWKDIDFNRRYQELVVTFRDGTLMPFRLLSDGVRNMLAMVRDIAYRAVVLNPFMGVNEALQVPGIVLIDEIDLHLHPKWQQHIVADLRHTFPNIQFIATTHSPFIIQSMQHDEVLNLNGLQGEYYLQSIEDIVEKVMGLPVPLAQRGRRFQEMWNTATKYYQLLEQATDANAESLKEIEVELDHLTTLYSDDIAYHAFLEMKRTAAGLPNKGE